MIGSLCEANEPFYLMQVTNNGCGFITRLFARETELQNVNATSFHTDVFVGVPLIIHTSISDPDNYYW